MKYYVEERKFEDFNKKTAGVKARDDAEVILKEKGYLPIRVWPDLGDRKDGSIFKKVKLHYMMGKLWKKSFQNLKKDDVLFLQLPVVNNYFFLGNELAKLRRKGCV